MTDTAVSSAAPAAAARTGGSGPKLQRVLSLRDLVFYGIVLLQPVGVIGLYGNASQLSHGHMATSILVAMTAMMFTAMSYGRMAALYPSAGSAYTYVGRGLNAHLGFLAGWAMILDYLVIPAVNVIYGAISAHQLFPAIPEKAWVLVIGVGMTLLNACGIRWTSRANQLLMAAMSAVVVLFAAAAVRHLLLDRGWTGLFSLAPFYNPAKFDFGAMCTATSFATAAYIGFDGITTLAEDTVRPKRNVPLATVLVCLITGLTAVLLSYLAQLIAPDPESFANLDTAFMEIGAKVAGPWLLQAIAVVMAVACFGSGLTSQAGAARLLYGMGRDKVLPQQIFGRLDARRSPTLNICIIGAVAIAGAFLLSYKHATFLINFGAFLAFIGVNASAIRVFWFQSIPGHRRQWLPDLALPGLGLLFSFWIWLSLPTPAKILGGIWFALGIGYAAIRTQGFRRQPVMLDFTEE